MDYRATVTSKGRITIPRAVRGALRLRQGDVLSFELDGNRAVVEPVIPSVSFAGDEGLWREGTGLTIDEINAEIREVRGHDE